MIDPKIAVEAGEARDEYIQKHAQVVAERDAACAERDRLRRELEAWRDNAQNHALTGDLYAALSVADRIDAILRGES